MFPGHVTMVEPRGRSSKSGRSDAFSATRCRLPPWARRGRRCGCTQFWRGRVAVSWQVRTIRRSSQMGAYASGAPGCAWAPGRLARWPAPGLRSALCARTDVAVTSRQSVQRLERRPRRPPGRPARESGERCALAASSRHNSPPGRKQPARVMAPPPVRTRSRCRGLKDRRRPKAHPVQRPTQAQTRCSAAQRGPDRPGATLVPPAHDEERHDQDHHRLSGPR
jgi:hypothetical protein